MTKIEDDPIVIMKNLAEQGGRATAKELGTNAQIMEALVEAGLAIKDGVKPTGKRGRPPVAFAPTGKELDAAAMPSVSAPKARSASGGGISQEAIDRHITDILSARWGDRRCTCLHVGQSLKDLRELGAGCTSGRWVCSSLDALRRRLGV